MKQAHEIIRDRSCEVCGFLRGLRGVSGDFQGIHGSFRGFREVSGAFQMVFIGVQGRFYVVSESFRGFLRFVEFLGVS